MEFLVIVVLLIVTIMMTKSGSEKDNVSKENTSADFHADARSDYADFETRTAKAEKDYFSGDLTQDYESYYAQVAEAAAMGDCDAIEEMREGFSDDNDEIW